MSLKPSKEQNTIIQWAVEDSGNGVMRAVAGAGKSTTLAMVASAVQQRKRGSTLKCFTFGKRASVDLQSKMDMFNTGFEASTLHSFGFKMIRNSMSRQINVNQYKVYDMIDHYLRDEDIYLEAVHYWALKFNVAHLVDFARMYLLEPTPKSMKRIARLHNIDAAEDHLEVACDLLVECNTLTRRDGLIDFTDMIYWPVHMKMDLPQGFALLDFVMIDEIQDLNLAQIELMKLLVSDKTRMIGAGDPAQSIQLFSGADAKSYERVRDIFNAIEMPLSVTYRCPVSHVELAKRYVPTIEARNEAPNGLIIEVTEPNKIYKMLQSRDRVISRWNAPLIPIVDQLLQNGQKAVILGNAVAEQVAQTLSALLRKYPDMRYKELAQYLDIYVTEKTQKMEMQGRTRNSIERFRDRASTLLACYRTFDTVTSTKELQIKVNTLCSNKEGDAIVLSSIHKMKGGEAERIFLIGADTLPYRAKDMTPDELKQEDNAHYVALTRSKNDLYLVQGKPGKLGQLPLFEWLSDSEDSYD